MNAVLVYMVRNTS